MTEMTDEHDHAADTARLAERLSALEVRIGRLEAMCEQTRIALATTASALGDVAELHNRL
jgi:hypothetical protein